LGEASHCVRLVALIAMGKERKEGERAMDGKVEKVERGRSL
jgi:hypothetical protein